MPRLQPTQKQIEFATALGIDIPEGATRGTISRLIQSAKDRRDADRLGLSRHPNDVISAALRGQPRGPSEETLRVRSAHVRSEGIRKGSIVLRGDRKCVVVDYAPGCELRVRNLETGVGETIAVGYFVDGVFQPAVWHVYTPPATHQPRLVFQSEIRAWKPHAVTKVMAYLDQRLDAANRFRNEHGEFWSRAAVEILYTKYADESKPAVKAVKPPAPPPAPRKDFCAACGTEFQDTTPEHHRRKCDECVKANIALGLNRFCIRCGSAFKSPSASVFRCSIHRDTPALSPTLT